MATITYDSNGFIIDGKHVVLSGGEMHYFRTPADLWESRIRMMAQAGCNLLTTYIPWNYHEAQQGKLNWSGDRDLPRFLDLCKKYGLYVLVKPGPYICAEWDFGGFPHWFLREEIDIRVDRQPYMDYTAKWFRDVAQVIRPYLVTNGGNIVSIQIENEYDHLMKYRTDITGDKATARAYILKLLQTVRDAGIDIPAFTIDGTPILGTEIINANTYYPNIPWIVMWVFDYFDELIESSMAKQPNMPLMVVEAQGGWFSQYKYDIYELEVEAFEAIAKTVAGFGGSILNFYMFCGGTNFPFWGSRGDFGGIGMTSSYDFGGASIREWGETHARYAVARSWNYFISCFPEIITQSKLNKTDVSFASGGRDIVSLGSDAAQLASDYTNSFAEMKLLLRKGKTCSGVLVRNIEPQARSFQLTYRSEVLDREIMIPHDHETTVGARYALFMPLDIRLDDEIDLVYSTSEIILKKQIGENVFVFLKGQKETQGEMLIRTPHSIECVEGDMSETVENEEHLLRYSHAETNVIKIGHHYLVTLERRESFKLWMQKNLILLTGCYHVENVVPNEAGTAITLLAKDEADRNVQLWHDGPVHEITVNGKPISYQANARTQSIDFEIPADQPITPHAAFTGAWKYKSDTEEARAAFDDSTWMTMPADTALERKEHYEHGYFWYRHEFQVDGKPSDFIIDFKMNDIDRYLLYINGRLCDVGTKSLAKKSISEFVQPGTNTLSILYANEFHPKAHPHEGPVQKLSGLFDPVTVSGLVDGKAYAHTVDTWKLKIGLQGDDAGYASTAFDDTSWTEAPIGKRYVVQEESGNLVWFRRSFKFEKEADTESPLMLRIGKLKERCLIFVNGVAVGRHEDCGPQYDYFIPDNILKAENQLTILLEGPGLHYRKHLGFRPGYFEELDFGFFYTARRIRVMVK